MPGRPHLTQLLRRPLSLVAAGVVLSACGAGPVEVEAHPVSPEDQQACRSFLDALPQRVADQRRTEVEGSSYAVAWGEDQTIVLRCGVGLPPEFDQTSECHLANGIGWYVPPRQADDQAADLTMTTVHRSPTVSVDLPAELRPPVAAMVDLAPAITARTTATGSCR